MTTLYNTYTDIQSHLNINKHIYSFIHCVTHLIFRKQLHNTHLYNSIESTMTMRSQEYCSNNTQHSTDKHRHLNTDKCTDYFIHCVIHLSFKIELQTNKDKTEETKVYILSFVEYRKTYKKITSKDHSPVHKINFQSCVLSKTAYRL